MTATAQDGPVATLGAAVVAGGTRFTAFARPATDCGVRFYGPDGNATETFAMRRLEGGFFATEVSGVGDGALYKFVVDGRELPDPYARFLPQGVHGPAMVTLPKHDWRHGAGVARPLAEHVIYELHVGTFTEAGTFQGVRQRLSELVALGVTAIQLMPIAAFAGRQGWGYDGVALYAPHAPYGTPDDLRALIDDAHGRGLSVFLDAVYNHFGPAGNYLGAYSNEYFTSEFRNAWGDAPSYAHPVLRQLVLDNALYWLTAFRFDGLRLDATHAIVDPSPRHILREMADRVAQLTPRKLLIAEDERNDAALVTQLGLDMVWADDFHHAVRTTLTGEQDGYYAGYQPGAAGVARTINRGWLYEGEIYPPTSKPRGTPAHYLDAPAFVYCIQNHDQVGNRAVGDRLNAAVSLDQYCAASTLLLFLPMTPLLFMGQEWAATSPFLFFTDHDDELGRLISQGRREEFKIFKAFSDPAVRAAIPDPQAVETFERSRLNWVERQQGKHARVLALHQALLALRKTDAVLRAASRRGLAAQAAGDVLVVSREAEAGARTLLLNFGRRPVALAELPIQGAATTLLFRSDGAPAGGRAGNGEGVLPPHTAIILASDAAR